MRAKDSYSVTNESCLTTQEFCLKEVMLTPKCTGGLLNESMVASVLAFIDFYRPKYALMENVKGMALGDEKHSVLAQVVCCLVGMGYQVRTSCLCVFSEPIFSLLEQILSLEKCLGTFYSRNLFQGSIYLLK